MITIAYDLGAKASSAYWDTPTQVNNINCHGSMNVLILDAVDYLETNVV